MLAQAKKRFGVPAALGVVVVAGALASGCGASTVSGVDASDDVAVDAAPDCAFTCVTEYYPGPDGSPPEAVTFYADGFTSDAVACTAPPPDPALCGPVV